MTALYARNRADYSPVRSLPPPGNFARQAPQTLAQAVEAAAGAVDRTTLTSVARPEAGPAFQPKALLALLTFCYARQIYGSEEVAARLRRDENLRRLCRDELPDAAVIRRFRSANRAALDGCLQAALRFMAEQKIAQGLVTRVSEAHLAEEAGRRLVMAMFIDSTEMNDERVLEGSTELCYLVA